MQWCKNSQVLNLSNSLVGNERWLWEDGSTLNYAVTDSNNTCLSQGRSELIKESAHTLKTDFVVRDWLFKLVLFTIIFVLIVTVDWLADLFYETGCETFARFQVNQLILDGAGTRIDYKDGFGHSGFLH